MKASFYCSSFIVCAISISALAGNGSVGTTVAEKINQVNYNDVDHSLTVNKPRIQMNGQFYPVAAHIKSANSVCISSLHGALPSAKDGVPAPVMPISLPDSTSTVGHGDIVVLSNGAQTAAVVGRDGKAQIVQSNQIIRSIDCGVFMSEDKEYSSAAQAKGYNNVSWNADGSFLSHLRT